MPSLLRETLLTAAMYNTAPHLRRASLGQLVLTAFECPGLPLAGVRAKYVTIKHQRGVVKVEIILVPSICWLCLNSIYVLQGGK